MELKNLVQIEVNYHDLIENTKALIYKGNATLSNNQLDFMMNEQSYQFTKIGAHYITLNHHGEMEYALDLKPNTSFESNLVVSGYEVPIECKCKKLVLHDDIWEIEYQIFQMDSLLFHNHLTIHFNK